MVTDEQANAFVVALWSEFCGWEDGEETLSDSEDGLSITCHISPDEIRRALDRVFGDAAGGS